MKSKRDVDPGLVRVLRFMIWMFIWEVISRIVGDSIPFAGPIETLVVLAEKMLHKEFYIAVWTTFSGIAAGFLAAMIVGTFLGYQAYFHKNVDFMITPVIDFFRYIPMITFTLLAIFWSHSSALAFEVSIFLALPVIYKHTLTGLKNSNQHYLKRVRQIKMQPLKKIIYIYQPVAMPEYIPGCHRALNMCWKSGIIAQLLGNTRHSIGSMLFTARDEADVAGIFAWTIVIVGLSVLFEQIVIRLLSLDKYNAGRVDLSAVFEELEDEEISL
ncbi:MAG: ABC transporter permease [Lachnospiraceae bacterium]